MILIKKAHEGRKPSTDGDEDDDSYPFYNTYYVPKPLQSLTDSSMGSVQSSPSFYKEVGETWGKTTSRCSDENAWLGAMVHSEVISLPAPDPPVFCIGL